MVRAAVESLYKGVCTVYEYREYRRDNGSTGHSETAVFTDIPCRLSFSAIPQAGQTDTAAALTQSVKLFTAPEYDIKPGSKITVTQEGRTTDYKSSGAPAVYRSHQEINLELFRGWA